MTRRITNRRSRNWIQGAIREPGSLRRYARGKRGAFTKKGTLSTKWLKKIINDPYVDKRTKKRARLALKLKQIKRKRSGRKLKRFSGRSGRKLKRSGRSGRKLKGSRFSKRCFG